MLSRNKALPLRPAASPRRCNGGSRPTTLLEISHQPAPNWVSRRSAPFDTALVELLVPTCVAVRIDAPRRGRGKFSRLRPTEAPPRRHPVRITLPHLRYQAGGIGCARGVVVASVFGRPLNRKCDPFRPIHRRPSEISRLPLRHPLTNTAQPGAKPGRFIGCFRDGAARIYARHTLKPTALATRAVSLGKRGDLRA